jgi:hypothetical protein
MKFLKLILILIFIYSCDSPAKNFIYEKEIIYSSASPIETWSNLYMKKEKRVWMSNTDGIQFIGIRSLKPIDIYEIEGLYKKDNDTHFSVKIWYKVKGSGDSILFYKMERQNQMKFHFNDTLSNVYELKFEFSISNSRIGVENLNIIGCDKNNFNLSYQF